MAAQKGKDLLLKIDDGSGNFITVGGMRTQRISINADAVDITSAESVGGWRELLANAGLRKATIAGTGLFKDQASDTLIRTAFFNGDIRNWQIIIPAAGTIQGLFQISALDWKGDYNNELTFDLSLESAGALVFTPM